MASLTIANPDLMDSFGIPINTVANGTGYCVFEGVVGSMSNPQPGVDDIIDGEITITTANPGVHTIFLRIGIASISTPIGIFEAEAT